MLICKIIFLFIYISSCIYITIIPERKVGSFLELLRWYCHYLCYTLFCHRYLGGRYRQTSEIRFACFLSCCGTVVAGCDNKGISTSTLGIMTSTTSVGLLVCIRIWFSQHFLRLLLRSRPAMWFWISESSSLHK